MQFIPDMSLMLTIPVRDHDSPARVLTKGGEHENVTVLPGISAKMARGKLYLLAAGGQDQRGYPEGLPTVRLACTCRLAEPSGRFSDQPKNHGVCYGRGTLLF